MIPISSDGHRKDTSWETNGASPRCSFATKGEITGMILVPKCRGQGRNSPCLMAACLRRVSRASSRDSTRDSDPQLRRREFPLPYRPKQASLKLREI